MIPLRSSTLTLWTIITALAALAAGIVWWRRHHQKSPAERERLRRLAVHAGGRLTDGALIDAPYSQEPASNRELLFYSYRVAGVEYSAAQDVSTLAGQLQCAICRPGTVATVKYDPRWPSNSIIICELWSGLPAQKADPVHDLRDGAAGAGLAGAA
jgi:hypothetical protein